MAKQKLFVEKIYGKSPKPGAYPNKLYRILRRAFGGELTQQLVHGVWAPSLDTNGELTTPTKVRTLDRKNELMEYNDFWGETNSKLVRIPAYLSERILRVYYRKDKADEFACGKFDNEQVSVVSMTSYDIKNDDCFHWVQVGHAQFAERAKSAPAYYPDIITWAAPTSFYFTLRRAATKKYSEVLLASNTNLAFHDYVDLEGVPEDGKSGLVGCVTAAILQQKTVVEQAEQQERDRREKEQAQEERQREFRERARRAEECDKEKQRQKELKAKRMGQKKKLEQPSLGLSTTDFADRIRLRRELEK